MNTKHHLNIFSENMAGFLSCMILVIGLGIGVIMLIDIALYFMEISPYADGNPLVNSLESSSFEEAIEYGNKIAAVADTEQNPTNRAFARGSGFRSRKRRAG